MYPPEDPTRPRSERTKQLITIIEELILVVQENNGVIERKEANQIVAEKLGLSSHDINYAGINGVTDGFLEYSFRSDKYVLGERMKTV